MKKLAIIIFTVIMLVLPVSVSAEALMLQYDDEVHEYTGSLYTLMVNNKIVETPLPPIIFNDRALVPIREVFEAMGATVEYEGNTRRITVKSDEVEVRLQINNNSAYVNSDMVAIPDGVVPKLIGRVGESAKTMVPVRFISESIGMIVEFDGENGIIKINQPEETPEPTQEPTAKPTQEPTAEPAEEIYIKNIGYDETDDGIDVVIKASGEIGKYSKSFLASPYRLVIDVENATLKTSKMTYDIGECSVERVRLGQHENSVRIVVDMEKKLEYEISVDDNRMYVQIIGEKSNSDNVDDEKDDEDVEATPDASTKPSTKPSVSNSEKIVVLDAGHGGHDPGASGVDDEGVKHQEKTITLAIVQKIRDILEEEGVSVILTRDDDTYVELVGRSEIANEANAAMFVSVHLNSVENIPTANGTEVYYASANNGDAYGLTSEELAENINDSLVESIELRERGVKTGNHVVTRTSNMPAVLIEVAFMSNVDEMTLLASEEFQDKAAEGIAEGILNSLDDVTVPEKTEDDSEIEYMTD